MKTDLYQKVTDQRSQPKLRRVRARGSRVKRSQPKLRRVRARGSRVTRVTGSDVPLSTLGAQRSSWSMVGASSRARAWAATPAAHAALSAADIFANFPAIEPLSLSVTATFSE